MHIPFQFKELLVEKGKQTAYKKFLVVFFTAVVLLLVYLVCCFVLFSPNHKTPNYADLDKLANANSKSAITAENKQAAPTSPLESDMPQTLDIAKAYPFINVTDISQNQSVPPVSPSAPLPVLPNDPNSALPLPPIYVPGNQSAGNVQAARTQDTAVRGVLIGDEGKNIAILSNGTLLREGEEYMESRIEAIDRGGIRLESGQKISFGINP